MVYHAIFITNHSGGLIYNRYFTEVRSPPPRRSSLSVGSY